jgi:hypothetical protein
MVPITLGGPPAGEMTGDGLGKGEAPLAGLQATTSAQISNRNSLTMVTRL